MKRKCFTTNFQRSFSTNMNRSGWQYHLQTRSHLTTEGRDDNEFVTSYGNARFTIYGWPK